MAAPRVPVSPPMQAYPPSPVVTTANGWHGAEPPSSFIPKLDINDKKSLFDDKDKEEKFIGGGLIEKLEKEKTKEGEKGQSENTELIQLLKDIKSLLEKSSGSSLENTFFQAMQREFH